MTQPTNLCEAIELAHEVGPKLKEAINACIQFDTNAERVAILKLRVRSLLDTAGYIWQGAYGLPDNYFGAGGGNKPALLPADTSVDCPGLPPAA